MSLHFQRQIESVKKRLLSLCALTEEALFNAIRAVDDRDPDLARQVVDGDERIDMLEVEIEEECLHTLALHQPVAFDLRYVVATMKINNELERVADLATNIAKQGIELTHLAEVNLSEFDLPGMGARVQENLRHSLDALIDLDTKLARQVKLDDKPVDNIHRKIVQKVAQAIREDPELVPVYLHLLRISRDMERIGDHAKNIAEDVIYMAEGDIARHKKSES